jgi:hypothetical protein
MDHLVRDRVVGYINDSLISLGFAVMDSTTAHKIRPDLWPLPEHARADFQIFDSDLRFDSARRLIRENNRLIKELSREFLRENARP